MNLFRYARAEQTAGRDPAGGRRPQGGVPGRRHQPHRPDAAQRRGAGPAGGRQRRCRSARSKSPTAACASGPWCATATWPTTNTIRTHYPVLSEALLSGASPQLRNMATVGGNLLQRTRCCVLPRHVGPLQQARSRFGLLRAGRLQPHPRRTRRQREVHRDPPLGHVRGPGRAGRGDQGPGAEGRARASISTISIWFPGDTPERETVLRARRTHHRRRVAEPAVRRAGRTTSRPATGPRTSSPWRPRPSPWKSKDGAIRFGPRGAGRRGDQALALGGGGDGAGRAEAGGRRLPGRGRRGASRTPGRGSTTPSKSSWPSG